MNQNMLDNTSYQKNLLFLQNHYPYLTQNYQQLVCQLNSYFKLGPLELENIVKLTLLSGKIYIDFNYILLAINRGEFNTFIDFLYQLYTHKDLEMIIAFLNHYHKLKIQLHSIAGLILQMMNNGLKTVKNRKKILDFCFSVEAAFQNYFFSLLLQIHIKTPANLIKILAIFEHEIKKMPIKKFILWCNKGLELFNSGNNQQAVSHLKIQSRESRELLKRTSSNIFDVEKFLHFFITSLSKKTLNICSNFQNNSRYKYNTTDGVNIYLPARIDYFASMESNESVYSIKAALIAGYLSEGTFTFQLEQSDINHLLRSKYGRSLAPIPMKLRQYYEDIEKIKELSSGQTLIHFNNHDQLIVLETELEKFYFSFPTPIFARLLFNLIENKRIEKKLLQNYQGLKEDFKNFYQFIARQWKIDKNLTSDKKTHLRYLLDQIIFYLLNQSSAPASSPLIDDKIRVNYQLIIKKIDSFPDWAGSTVYDSIKLTFEIYNIFFDAYPLVVFCEKNNLKQYFRKLLLPEIAAELVFNTCPEILGLPGKEADKPRPDNEARIKKVDFSSFSFKKNKTAIKKIAPEKGIKIFHYAEYDYYQQTYVKDKCTVFEATYKSANNALYFNQVLTKYNKLSKQLKKKFLLLQAEELEVFKKQPLGEDIDLNDAADLLIDLKMNRPANENIFIRRKINNRDITVALLIDNSSSTLEKINEITINEIEKEAVCLLGNTLNSIGDQFGIFSFNSSGPKDVNYYIIKDFDEQWNDYVIGKIPNLTPAAANRDGCAIRHTINKMKNWAAKTKLLLMLSDGIPADKEYGSQDCAETNRYAIEDTRKSLLECKLNNIHAYCITIDKKAKNYAPYLYGSYNFAIINDLRKLPEKMMNIYLKLTK